MKPRDNIVARVWGCVNDFARFSPNLSDFVYEAWKA